MRNNFHTHTYRCGHAKGNEEEMVISAIKKGYDILGFSDHIPLPNYRFHLLKALPKVIGKSSLLRWGYGVMNNGPRMRTQYKYMKTHLKNIADCQEKYAGKIKIIKGFEAEYFPDYLDYFQSLLDHHVVDYLILGNHFYRYSTSAFYYARPNVDKIDVERYTQDIIDALDTELYSYIAHPDLFMVGYKHWDETTQIASAKICHYAKIKGIPLELNGGGIRRGLREVDGEMLYPYPNAHFWKIASQMKNKVIIGMDAHAPEELGEEVYLTLIEFAKKYDLDVIDHFEFKKGKSK